MRIGRWTPIDAVRTLDVGGRNANMIGSPDNAGRFTRSAARPYSIHLFTRRGKRKDKLPEKLTAALGDLRLCVDPQSNQRVRSHLLARKCHLPRLQSRLRPGPSRQTRHHPFPSPQLCHPPPGGGLRHPYHSRALGALQRRDDHDLYPRSQHRPLPRAQPLDQLQPLAPSAIHCGSLQPIAEPPLLAAATQPLALQYLVGKKLAPTRSG